MTDSQPTGRHTLGDSSSQNSRSRKEQMPPISLSCNPIFGSGRRGKYIFERAGGHNKPSKSKNILDNNVLVLPVLDSLNLSAEDSKFSGYCVTQSMSHKLVLTSFMTSLTV